MDDGTHGMKHSAPVHVWPFAITRSVNTGFRVVAAPDFLVDAHRHALLHDVTEGEPTEDAVYRREYRGAGAVPLFLLYRIVHLKAADVGRDGEYAMSGPRRTPLIEGVVCRTPSGPPATRELFDEVHRRCVADVRAFFDADTAARPVTPCPSFEAPETGETLRIEDLDPYPKAVSTLPPFRAPRPSWLRRLVPAVLSALRSALGLRTGRQPAGRRGAAPGAGGKVAGSSSEPPGEGGKGPGRRLARTAGAVVLSALIAFLVRKLK
ncbi:hypothetical protein [Streptomyces pilosus]|uniref:Uncharacterized protein n=1 Tax=Streptomyces pilosus TaxID=28893 RepID=A0A918BLW1_9ACTN|nr:hypothetical protein [Streptomyces pilosus]GGQ78616.1 hypothetical protein GCM10010280_26490 [Streptomyces pilosus]